jgi:CheY-like chemotaxis protein
MERRSKPRLTASRHTAARRPTLLWVDDYAPSLALYAAMFEMHGFKVLTASSGSDGIRLALSNRIDLVVTDYEMPGLDGESVAAAIKALYPRTPVLLFSGSTLVSARCRRLVDACCDKARSREELLDTVHRLLGRKRGPTLQPPVAWRASEQGNRTVA